MKLRPSLSLSGARLAVRARAYAGKWRGAVGASRPKWGAGMPWPQVLVTWAGATATLLALSALHEAFARAWGADAPKLLVGSFGALMTLMFGACPIAPATRRSRRSSEVSRRKLRPPPPPSSSSAPLLPPFPPRAKARPTRRSSSRAT